MRGEYLDDRNELDLDLVGDSGLEVEVKRRKLVLVFDSGD